MRNDGDRHDGKSASLPPVPFLDVGRGNQPMRGELLEAIARVIDSGRFLHGSDVKSLEEEIAELCGCRHAIACASGSDALLLALMAFDIGPDDEVIVPSFTFFATASVAWRLGAKPVFVDIDPVTFNLRPECIAAALTPRTKAIIPVHLFGQCANMEAIGRIARQHGIRVVEDAAQSIGAEFDNQVAGAMSDVACFSFYPTKNLGAFGDGGLVTTSDDFLAERLRLLAAHGMNPRYYHRVVGINSRLDSIQAAILRVKLKRLDEWTQKRQANAKCYHQLFSDAGLDHVVTLPQVALGRKHVWNQYTIRVPGGNRDRLRQHLTSCAVGTEVYYPVPLHLQECFRSLEYIEGSLPETERAAQEVISLPIYPELTFREQQTVVNRIVEFVVGRQAAAA